MRSVRVLTLRRSFSSTSSTSGFTPRSESSPRATRASSSASASLGYAPGSGPVCGTVRVAASARSASAVMSGQSTGSTRHTSFDAMRSAAIKPKIGARSSAPSSKTGNGRAASSALPIANTSSQTSCRMRHPRPASVSPRNGASAFGVPKRSEAPPTRRIPVTARRCGTAPCTPSRVPRGRSRRA
jgi:hypothetical protein